MWGDSEDAFWIEGQTKPARHADMPSALWYEVEPDYLKVMGIPLKRGRFFTAQDNEYSPLVTVIDESFAEKYFPNEDPIGKGIVDEFLGKPAEIVGVVGHVKHWGLDDKINLNAQFYIPFMQIPDKFMSRAADSTGVLIRTQGEPLALVGAVRKKVSEMNSQDVVFEAPQLRRNRFEITRRALVFNGAARNIRGARAGALEHRNLRRDFLCSWAADARNRNPNRVGRATERCARAGAG